MSKIYNGCWPTMITPFTPDNKIDYEAVKGLVEWYIKKGSSGIFAVCQSSEMFYLSEQEKLDLAKAVVEQAAGRIKVIASGHTADDHNKQIEELGKMSETGVDAVVLVSNRFAKKDEGEDVFRKNADDVFRQLPNVTFGLYECPAPYLRLLSDDFLQDCAKTGKLVFLKDVSCSREILSKEQTSRFSTPTQQPFWIHLSTDTTATTVSWQTATSICMSGSTITSRKIQKQPGNSWTSLPSAA